MDAQLVTNDRAGREQFFIALYKKAFPAVARYVSKMGGSFDEAKDVFQDALVIYYEKEVAVGNTIETNQKAYLFGIAKHLWIRRYHQAEGNIPLDMLAVDPQSAEDDQHYASTRIMHYLETAGKKCMDMLQSFYYHRLPVTQIAEMFGYSGIRSATVQKYKCLEKVRNTIKQKSLTYEDFLE